MTGKRVAVIGSGLAGLSCAWWLSECGVTVDMYEKESSIGLGAHSVQVANTDTFIDVPARVFVHGFYKQMLMMYEYIGIETSVASAAPSFQYFGSLPHFKFHNYLTSSGRAIPYIRPSILWNNAKTIFNIIIDVLRYKYYCSKVLKDKNLYLRLGGVTVEQFLQEQKYSTDFINGFLIPSFAVIATCSCEAVKNYPMNIVIQYTNSVFLTGRTFRRLKHGTKHTAHVMSEKISSVFTTCDIESVRIGVDGRFCVRFRTADAGDGSIERMYDELVFAVPANKVAAIHPSCGVELASALDGIKYEYSECVVHNDVNLMPLSSQDWSPLNIVSMEAPIDENKNESDRSKTKGVGVMGCVVMCTIWQNQIQELPRDVLKTREEEERGTSVSDDIYQTWNPRMEPHPRKMLHNGRASFLRSVVDLDTGDLLKVIDKHQGDQNIWYCGAYSQPGVPLLENACDSGLRVAEHITGRGRPWILTSTDTTTSTNTATTATATTGHRYSLLNLIHDDQRLHIGPALIWAGFIMFIYWLFVKMYLFFYT